MPENKNLVQCYNRGCGQLFDLNENDKDVCCHHPGAPVFHDAYKGWSCCNKKSVDFTEFLNIKGCTLSKHSNVKPPEPEKKVLDKELEKKEVIEVRAPVLGPQLPRPSFETPLVTLKPQIAESLKNMIQQTAQKSVVESDGTIAIGTTCKNAGCNIAYEGPQTNDTMCTFHPGCPIFHEGLKFWSCCQKRTTDFNTFLAQPGCTTGSHKWFKETTTAGTVKCRWDWHQTPEYVIVSVYAKKYDPVESYVKLNPIRLNTKLVFHQEGSAVFELDLELRGVIDLERSSASMLGTKVEIKLKKAEPGAWSKIDFPRAEPKKETVQATVAQVEDKDDVVDLSSVEAITPMNNLNLST
ncbi:PREDICTED: cysteine and histidine-rich domain-containing protein [Papilio xuthus]|uniref:Cysteine and histidine-rich domain-containing protein n=1 Tax=Papilio xuthus TaxID=66420 RepID=A0A194PHA6_PAPXU|nr:PREDICTED: cysteine and histidine-rich domain-containing protein [Papilio xuthus]KPI92791.1 Cysteine and histidine-rich domain-containing protein [Papilio xuthus]